MSKKQKQTKKQKRTQKQNNWLWVILGVVVIVLVVVLLVSPGGKDDTQPATVTVQEAAAKFDEGAFLLDVREQSEWNEAHIEGAVLIPLGELSSRMGELPTDREVLIICRSGNRSGQARDLLRQAGMLQTTSISGGINAWIAAGLPVVSGP